MKYLKKNAWYRKTRELGKAIRTNSFLKNTPTRKLRKYLARQFQQFLFKRKLNKATPIFVCQMGKVGSRSIVDSLEKYYPGVVLHGHLVRKMDWQAQYILEWVHHGNPLKIISPVRDPISRNISAFFHFIEGRIGHASDRSNLPITKLVELFISNDSTNEDDNNKAMMAHNLPLDWFDNNIKNHFGIDVFSTPFPSSKFATYSYNNTELLVLRIDIADKKKEELIQNFIDFPSFKLKNTNIGASKGYSSKYKEFKNNAKLPEDYLDKMCKSKYFSHFYTDVEINTIRNQWNNKTGK